MAGVRALESRRPAGERLFEDRFAFAFLGWEARMVVRLASTPLIGRVTASVLDRLRPGVTDAVAARTRHIDDALRAAFANGGGQVAILGAGFDSRAYRIAGIERARVFELDHPQTQ